MRLRKLHYLFASVTELKFRAVEAKANNGSALGGGQDL